MKVTQMAIDRAVKGIRRSNGIRYFKLLKLFNPRLWATIVLNGDPGVASVVIGKCKSHFELQLAKQDASTIMNKLEEQDLVALPIVYDLATARERRVAREKYMRLQRNKCWYCKEPLSGDPCRKVMKAKLNSNLFPECMLLHPVHLHHDRETGYTIGAVHARCNAYLWQRYGH
jgi:hypothetical protein